VVRLFRRTVGMAPLAFLAELRLTLARHRIHATRMPMAVIAEDVGYQSETGIQSRPPTTLCSRPGGRSKGPGVRW
jgi:AraC family transcriptional regulator, activator of mtrCDE